MNPHPATVSPNWYQSMSPQHLFPRMELVATLQMQVSVRNKRAASTENECTSLNNESTTTLSTNHSTSTSSISSD